MIVLERHFFKGGNGPYFTDDKASKNNKATDKKINPSQLVCVRKQGYQTPDQT